ncbi:hypothetical protein CDAR_253431 [Caerostris darwini]|uniref:Uncharacterized protein n=1 Tax=Caerostris darwini TaxID=1538125 RepID=A0AAV4MJM3_9ARAC|nr:hypothetical protein CDAR_253431 [Caerostris darwini]
MARSKRCHHLHSNESPSGQTTWIRMARAKDLASVITFLFTAVLLNRIPECHCNRSPFGWSQTIISAGACWPLVTTPGAMESLLATLHWPLNEWSL